MTVKSEIVQLIEHELRRGNIDTRSVDLYSIAQKILMAVKPEHREVENGE